MPRGCSSLNQGLNFRRQQRVNYSRQPKKAKKKIFYPSEIKSKGRTVQKTQPSNNCVSNSHRPNSSNKALACFFIAVLCVGGVSTLQSEVQPKSKESLTQNDVQTQCMKSKFTGSFCSALSSQELSVSGIMHRKKTGIMHCYNDIHNKADIMKQKNEESFKQNINGREKQANVIGNNTLTIATAGFEFAAQETIKGQNKIFKSVEKIEEQTQSAYNKTIALKQHSANVILETSDVLKNATSNTISVFHNVTDSITEQVKQDNNTHQHSITNFTEAVIDNTEKLFLDKLAPTTKKFNDTIKSLNETKTKIDRQIQKNRNFSIERFTSGTTSYIKNHPAIIRHKELKDRMDNLQEDGTINEEYLVYLEGLSSILAVAISIYACFQKRNILKEEADLEKVFEEYKEEISNLMVLKNKSGLRSVDILPNFQYEVSTEELCLLIIESEKTLDRLNTIKARIS